jgi:hypothetical protein
MLNRRQALDQLTVSLPGMPDSKSREQLAVDFHVNCRGHTVSGCGTIGLAEQARDDFPRSLAPRDGDAAQPLSVIGVEVDHYPAAHALAARVVLDQVRIERLEQRVEVYRLRVVRCPDGIAHGSVSKSLRWGIVASQPVITSQVVGSSVGAIATVRKRPA